MTLLSSYGNPYLRTPPSVAAGTFVSGGGGDGCIDVVVALLLRWARPTPAAPVTGAPPDLGGRGFDMAELIARAATAAGVTPTPPIRGDLLRAACMNAGTDLEDAAAGLGRKGALLFGDGGAVGVALGMRGRALIYEAGAGVVVDDAMTVWTSAALLPGAWGYR